MFLLVIGGFKESGSGYIQSVEPSMDTATDFSVSFDVVNDKLFGGSDK